MDTRTCTDIELLKEKYLGDPDKLKKIVSDLGFRGFNIRGIKTPQLIRAFDKLWVGPIDTFCQVWNVDKNDIEKWRRGEHFNNAAYRAVFDYLVKTAKKGTPGWIPCANAATISASGVNAVSIVNAMQRITSSHCKTLIVVDQRIVPYAFNLIHSLMPTVHSVHVYVVLSYFKDDPSFDLVKKSSYQSWCTVSLVDNNAVDTTINFIVGSLNCQLPKNVSFYIATGEQAGFQLALLLENSGRKGVYVSSPDTLQQIFH